MKKLDKRWIVLFILILAGLNLIFRQSISNKLFVVIYTALIMLAAGYFLISWLWDYLKS